MAIEYIQYGDNGKVAREKINTIMAEVEAHIPSIGENGNWYLGPTDTGIPAIGVRLREENNLIKRDNRLEMYADLQLADGISPTDTFPVGILVGNARTIDGRAKSGVLMNAKATNGTYVRWLYGDDGKLYFDGGIGVFKIIPTNEDVVALVEGLRSELHQVAFTGKASDLNNDYGFTAVPLMTEDEYHNTPGHEGDDKEYGIYEIVQID